MQGFPTTASVLLSGSTQVTSFMFLFHSVLLPDCDLHSWQKFSWARSVRIYRLRPQTKNWRFWSLLYWKEKTSSKAHRFEVNCSQFLNLRDKDRELLCISCWALHDSAQSTRTWTSLWKTARVMKHVGTANRNHREIASHPSKDDSGRNPEEIVERELKLELKLELPHDPSSFPLSV